MIQPKPNILCFLIAANFQCECPWINNKCWVKLMKGGYWQGEAVLVNTNICANVEVVGSEFLIQKMNIYITHILCERPSIIDSSSKSSIRSRPALIVLLGSNMADVANTNFVCYPTCETMIIVVGLLVTLAFGTSRFLSGWRDLHFFTVLTPLVMRWRIQDLS